MTVTALGLELTALTALQVLSCARLLAASRKVAIELDTLPYAEILVVMVEASFFSAVSGADSTFIRLVTIPWTSIMLLEVIGEAMSVS